MFKLVSEDRQRKSAVLQIVRKSVPSGFKYRALKATTNILNIS